jgi:hypothetical protein
MTWFEILLLLLLFSIATSLHRISTILIEANKITVARHISGR